MESAVNLAPYTPVAPAITFNGSSYRSQVGEVIEDEYNEYVGDPDKIVALFQEGLDELGVETPIEDITLTYLTSGSTTEVQAESTFSSLWKRHLDLLLS